MSAAVNKQNEPERERAAFSFDHGLKRTLFALGIGVLVLMVFVAKFDHLSDVNAIDYAQIARNVSEGKGFTTSAVTPLALALTGKSQKSIPDVSRPPLWVSALALAMRVGGANDRVVVFASIVFLLLTLGLIYVLGRMFFDEGIGIYAVAITAISTGLMVQAMTGLETPFLAFLITLLFGLLLLHGRSNGPTGVYWSLLSGVLLGLCFLTRFECLAIVPAILLYWLFAGKRRRWLHIGLTVAAFAVVALPWVIRTDLVAGRMAASTQSYELIMQTIAHPGQTLYREFVEVPPLPLSVVLDHPLQMFKKFNESFRAAYSGFPQMLNPYVLALFLASFFIPAIRNRYGLIQWCLGVGILLMTAGMGLYTNVLRLLLAFAPLVTLLATAAFINYLNEYARERWSSDLLTVSRWFRSLALFGWILVLAYPMGDYLFATRPVRQAPMVATVREVAAKGNFIMTDIPWHMAWYGNKPSLLVPQSVAQLEALQKAGVRPDTIYLSPNLINLPETENMKEWQQLLFAGKEFDGFSRSTDWRQAGAVFKLRERAQ
jgi:4-amino-4-deoxy-L-arabinose transferase-like glycosyltransferase